MNSQTLPGIWKYADLLPAVEKKYRLSQEEGNTKVLERDGIFFKSEFENPTGSVKDRGIAYQLSYLRQNGITQVALSSSGNAAISLISYAKLVPLNVTVFISPTINKNKKKLLEKEEVKIIESPKAVSECIKYCSKTGIYNLRPSLDPVGHIGFETISFELYEKYPEIDAIFLPVSSATTLKGVFTGYKKKGKIPKLYAIQTQTVHPIAKIFDQDFKKKNISIVDGIVARYTPRLKEAQDIIEDSHGGGFVASDEEIKEADAWLENQKIHTSYEGALALAGLWKALRIGKIFQKPLIFLTGKKYD